LRAQSVANIARVADIQSEIAYREAVGELPREQAAKLRRLAPLDVEAAEAEIAEKRAKTATEEQLREPRIKELQSEAAYKSALAAQRGDLYDVPNPAGGKPLKLTASEAAAYFGQVEARGALARERYIDNVRQARMAEQSAHKDERSRLEQVASAEAKIVGMASAYKEAAIPWMELFNRESEANYVWIHFPNISRGLFSDIESKYDNENTRVVIPPMASGGQPTARDISEAASELGMTVKDYLEKVYFPKKVGRPAPWLPK